MTEVSTSREPLKVMLIEVSDPGMILVKKGDFHLYTIFHLNTNLPFRDWFGYPYNQIPLLLSIIITRQAKQASKKSYHISQWK